MNRGQHFTRISTKTSHFTPSMPSKFLEKKLRKVKKSRGLDHVWIYRGRSGKKTKRAVSAQGWKEERHFPMPRALKAPLASLSAL